MAYGMKPGNEPASTCWCTIVVASVRYCKYLRAQTVVHTVGHVYLGDSPVDSGHEPSSRRDVAVALKLLSMQPYTSSLLRRTSAMVEVPSKPWWAWNRIQSEKLRLRLPTENTRRRDLWLTGITTAIQYSLKHGESVNSLSACRR